MKFTVDRAKWYRGQGSKTSKLLRPDGTRCCIGHVGKQLGIPDEALLGRGAVRQGLYIESCWPEWMKMGEPLDINRAYMVNDSSSMTDSERELQLQEIFIRNGDEIEFVG